MNKQVLKVLFISVLACISCVNGGYIDLCPYSNFCYKDLPGIADLDVPCFNLNEVPSFSIFTIYICGGFETENCKDFDSPFVESLGKFSLTGCCHQAQLSREAVFCQFDYILPSVMELEAEDVLKSQWQRQSDMY
ncbi:MAG: hypothetical protein ACIAQZ_16800 [Sedimentisphaeraceae bacterium JB056]